MNTSQIEKINALIEAQSPKITEETFAPKGGGGRTWVKVVRIKNVAGDVMKVSIARKTVTTIIGAGAAGDEGHTVSESYVSGGEWENCLRCMEYQKSAWRNPQYAVSETDIENFLNN